MRIYKSFFRFEKCRKACKYRLYRLMRTYKEIVKNYILIYAKYEYQDEIECFPDVFALIERDLRQCNFDSAAMKTVEALDGKL